MLTNYYNYDAEKSVSTLLNEVKDRKNFDYVILNTDPKSVVDIRTLSLKTHNDEEKLKTLKKNLPFTSSTNKYEVLDFLIQSGEKVIEYPKGFYDFLNGLKDIKSEKPQFFKKKLELNTQSQIYALNINDKVATAKHMLTENKINMLPVIDDNLEILGELRTIDLFSSNLYNQKAKDYYSEQTPQSLLNTAVENVMYDKPITISKEKNIKDAIELMISKSVPSVIITDDNSLFSVVSYKDIFKYYINENKEKTYNIEYVGFDSIESYEMHFIRKVADKTAKKISKRTQYNEFKLTFKTHGNNEDNSGKRGEIICNAIAGNKVIGVEKEYSPGTSYDEDLNDKNKQEWNIGKLIKTALKALEEKIEKENHK